MARDGCQDGDTVMAVSEKRELRRQVRAEHKQARQRQRESDKARRDAWNALKHAALDDVGALTEIRERVVDHDHLSEAAVQNYIDAAKADNFANTTTLVSAMLNLPTLNRQAARYNAVAGFVQRVKVGFTEIGLSIGVAVLLIVMGWWSSGWPWWGYTPPSLALGALCYLTLQQRDKYYRVYARALVLERSSFTRPEQPTGVMRVFIPRLCGYNRPEVWRGPNAHNGVFDKPAFMVFQSGFPTPVWLNNKVPNLIDDEGAEVEDGTIGVVWAKRNDEFRNPQEVYDLPADPYTARTEVMKARRGWHRRLQMAGANLRKAEKRQDNKWLENWQLIAMAGGFGGGLLVMMMSGMF